MNYHELELIILILKMNDQHCYHFYQISVHVVVPYHVLMVYRYDFDDDKIFQNDSVLHHLNESFHLDFEDE